MFGHLHRLHEDTAAMCMVQIFYCAVPWISFENRAVERSRRNNARRRSQTEAWCGKHNEMLMEGMLLSLSVECQARMSRQQMRDLVCGSSRKKRRRERQRKTEDREAEWERGTCRAGERKDRKEKALRKHQQHKEQEGQSGLVFRRVVFFLGGSLALAEISALVKSPLVSSVALSYASSF